MLKRLAILVFLFPFITVGVLMGQDALKGTPKGRIAESDSSQKGQEKPQTQSNNQPTPPSAPPGIKPAAPTCDESCQNARLNLQIQNKLVWLTGGLVVVGLLQVGSMIWQAILLWSTRDEVHSQANWMKTQAGHMSRQADLMDQQLAEVKSGSEIAKVNADAASVTAKASALSAVAAEESAKAALAQIQLMKNKEKARIKIEAGKLEITQPEVGAWMAEVELKVFNFGQTRAFLDESQASFVFSKSSEIQTDKYPHPMISDAAIGPTEEPIRKRLYQFSDIESDTIWKLNTENAYAQVYGFVAYKDAFGDEHRTSFRYIWRANGWILAAQAVLAGGDPNGSKALYGEWEKTEKDNEEY